MVSWSDRRVKTVLLGGIKGIALTVLVAWLFYQSLWGLVILPAVLVIMIRKELKMAAEKEKEQYRHRFSEFLEYLEEAMVVGYSFEGAIGEAEKGLKTLYSEGEPLLVGLSELRHKMTLGMAAEAAFSEFALQSGCEEAVDFSEVLLIAKRTGGSLRQVIQNTKRLIMQKQEVVNQIQSVLYGRIYENRVMKAMPFAMLGYLRLCLPDFLLPLYHNVAGIGIMTAVLLCYGGLCLAIDRISTVI